MPQLTKQELHLIDKTVRKKGLGKDAIDAINKIRKTKKIQKISPSAVYGYIRGERHQPDRKDKRGSQRILKPRHVKKLMKVRRQLIKKANNAQRVTYEDVIRAANLDVEPCQKLVEETLKAEGVGYRPARAKIQITSQDAEKRLAFGEKWQKKPADFWTDGEKVHGYHDLKAWPMTLTEAQRLRYQQTKVTGHLRLASEGCEQGFTKPKQNHQWIGIPSVTISAVVSAEKVLVWEVIKGSWNGEKAQELYTGPIKKAFTREYGDLRTIVILLCL
jgi:hypothetical protein